MTLPMLMLVQLAGVRPSRAADDGPPDLVTTSNQQDDLCKPAFHAPDVVPPCIEIENIEALCYPNGTAPLYIQAHAQCLCQDSYFAEWTACRRCHFLHGQLSERNLNFYLSIATTASSSLCGFLSPTPEATAAAAATPSAGSVTSSAPAIAAPPTAIFRDLFTSVEMSLAFPTAGSTAAVDVAKGNTAVSLYFTASGSLGPGPITGSATAATATGGLVVATGRPDIGAASAGAPGRSGSSESVQSDAAAAARSPLRIWVLACLVTGLALRW